MMGTISQERATTNNSRKPPTKDSQTTKPQWNNGALTKQSKKVYKPGVSNGPYGESKIPVPETGYQPKRRSKPDRPPLSDTPGTQRQLYPKTSPQPSSLWEVRERPQKQASHSKNNKDPTNTGPGRGRCHVSHYLNHSSELRRDCSWERRPQSLDEARPGKDSDSDSDLSDTERVPASPTPGPPPNLNLRAEVIDPTEFQRSHAAAAATPRRQCQFNKSYPDFLPPPFNAWSLRQLAVFLNTEGKGVARPRPVDQLEKYLERLLKLEWHQFQTIQEIDNSGSGNRGAPRPTGHPRPHSSPSTNLSTPKSILQCQRSFPLSLLSSITKPMPVQLVGCACPHCHSRYPHCNGSCRTYTYQHNSHLSSLMERRGRPTVSKRSSSESRIHVSEPAFPSRGYKPGSFNGSSHLRRMQAAGNIRNPSLSPPRLQPPGSVFTSMEAGVRRGRDPSGGGDSRGRVVREDSQRRRAVLERRKVVSNAKQDLKVNTLAATEHAGILTDKASGRSTGRVKRVDFVT